MKDAFLLSPYALLMLSSYHALYLWNEVRPARLVFLLKVFTSLFITTPKEFYVLFYFSFKDLEKLSKDMCPFCASAPVSHTRHTQS